MESAATLKPYVFGAGRKERRCKLLLKIYVDYEQWHPSATAYVFIFIFYFVHDLFYDAFSGANNIATNGKFVSE
jgi:hypothetical protein